MEVHSHTHTERKKFTHYLWEFLMLFLAVFCGFLAENKRESLVEKKREKEYINSLVADIHLDLKDLEKEIRFRSDRIKQFDSLFEIFRPGNWIDRTNDIYVIVRQSTGTRNLSYHDGTIQQLKNSGGLRLIRDIDISNKIIDYDAQVRRLLIQQELEGDLKAKILDKAAIAFDPIVFYDMKKDADSTEVTRPVGNPPLKKTELLYEILGQLQYLRNIYKTSIRLQEKIINSGNQLVSDLKNKYHLNNE